MCPAYEDISIGQNFTAMSLPRQPYDKLLQCIMRLFCILIFSHSNILG